MQTNLQWEQMFNNYDNGEKGFLSPEELQKLIYEEFRGFITIRNLKTYLHLINLKSNIENKTIFNEKIIQNLP